MGDDGIGAGLGHRLGFVRRGDIDNREEVHLAGERDHFEFLFHAHAGFFKDLPKRTVHDAVSGEIVHTGKAHGLHLEQPVPHAPARVGGVNAANDRDFLDDGEHFELADFHRHGVGVAVGHQAAGRAMAGHAKAAGVVDDDEIGAAALDEFGADARAGSGGDDRLAFPERCPEAFDDFFATVRVSFSGPGIGHGWFNLEG